MSTRGWVNVCFSLSIVGLILGTFCADIFAEEKKDPAKMTLDEKQAAGICPVEGKEAKLIYHLTLGGKKYTFCCRKCQEAFKADPAKFGYKGEAPKEKPAPKSSAPEDEQVSPPSKDEMMME